MDKHQLDDTVRSLLSDPDAFQEFVDLLSIEENWRKVDKSIKLPSYVEVAELDCPSCFDSIRLRYDKFRSDTYSIPLTCPHCSAKLNCVSEFAGYTCDVHLEEE